MSVIYLSALYLFTHKTFFVCLYFKPRLFERKFINYQLGYPALLGIFIVSSVSLSFYLSVSLCISISLYLYLSVSLSLCISISLYLYLSVSLSLRSIYLSLPNQMLRVIFGWTRSFIYIVQMKNNQVRLVEFCLNLV